VSPNVVTVKRSDLERRKASILATLGLTLEEFRELAGTRTLTGDEWDAKEELDEIDFLLGSDAA